MRWVGQFDRREKADPRRRLRPRSGPKATTEIAKLAKDVARKKAENEMVDQPAPDFNLTVLDGPGKTRRVTKGDLAGKVVLLDFWATWCGPCLTELPDIQTAHRRLRQGEEAGGRGRGQHRPGRRQRRGPHPGREDPQGQRGSTSRLPRSAWSRSTRRRRSRGRTRRRRSRNSS